MPDPCAGVVQIMGHVVPPVRPLQQRWCELEAAAAVNGSKESQGKADFMAFPNGDLRAGHLQPTSIPIASSAFVDFDQTEHYSRVFRSAIKLAARYEVDADVAEFSVGAATWVSVTPAGQTNWTKRKPPSIGDVIQAVNAIRNDVLPPPVPAEMCMQVDNPDVFMLWAAGGKAPNDYPATCLLVDTLLLGLAQVIYEVKARAKVPRPVDKAVVNPVKNSLRLPEHSSWPAGHAFVGGAMARLLLLLQGSVSKQDLLRAAERIGYNRIRGGLHTWRDVDDGVDLGWGAMDRLLADASAAAALPNPNKHERRLERLWALTSMAKKEW